MPNGQMYSEEREGLDAETFAQDIPEQDDEEQDDPFGGEGPEAFQIEDVPTLPVMHLDGNEV